jgi:putative transposase
MGRIIAIGGIDQGFESSSYYSFHGKEIHLLIDPVEYPSKEALSLHYKDILLKYMYVFGHSNNNNLVFRTLELALEATPGGTPMIHSDRGFQYTTLGFKARLDSYGLTQSMSRVGKCINNGPMEAFWGTLKCEKYYLNKYQTFEALKKDIDDYIYFYNHERLQAKLNSLSPIEVRTKAA